MDARAWKNWGDVTAPDDSKGFWTIERFTLTEDDVLLGNLRAIRDNPIMFCPPGTYVRLCSAGLRNGKPRGTVMSNTPMERRTAIEAYANASGCVLVNGLGLGMVVEGMLNKPSDLNPRVKAVEKVIVTELDADVIALVGPNLRKRYGPRINILNVDAFAFDPRTILVPGQRFNYVWHDIWDDLSGDNLPEMATLNRKYGRFALAQGTWSRREVRAEARRYG